MAPNHSTPVQADKIESRYIKLDPEFHKHLVWSTDPRDLGLHGTFSEDNPNLSSDFNMQGLKPILKEDGGNRWILKDTQEEGTEGGENTCLSISQAPVTATS